MNQTQNPFDLKTLDEAAKKVVAKYDKKHAAVLTLLHLAQEKIDFITPAVEEWVSKWTEVPVVHVKEVVTFYSMYRKKKGGKHHIRFCTGTSCFLSGSEKTLEHLKKKIGAANGEVSSDGKFSLEEAECLCACEVAPMMQVDDEYIGNLTEEKIDEVLKGLK